MPRLRGKALDAAEQVVAQEKPRVMKSTGPAKDSLEVPLIEPAERPVDKEWAEMMAFAKEKITIRVAESTDKNAELVVEVFNNGDRQLFPRGQEVTCERRFVESLCRAKPTTFTQKRIRVEESGLEQYIEQPHTALRYPFQVVRDDNRQGADWLKAMFASA